MPEHNIGRLRRFRTHNFPCLHKQYQDRVEHGQHLTILLIGCSDSRVVPYFTMDGGRDKLSIVRNVGDFASHV